MNIFLLIFLNKFKCCFRSQKRPGILKVFILLSTCIYSGTSPAYSQSFPYRFNYLTVDVGLSHTDANDIIQDKLGYIWIATHFGLDRFDGYNVKKFYNSNVPLNNAYKNRILCMYADVPGNIWLGTEGGLQSFDSQTEKYIDYPLSGDKVQPKFEKLIKKEDNIIYGLAGGQIKSYTIKGRSIEEIRLPVPAGVTFSDMSCDNSGTLYLASNKGVWTLDKQRLFENVPVTGCPDLKLSTLYFDLHQNLLIAAGEQLFFAKKSINKLKPASGSQTGFVVDKQYTGGAGMLVKNLAEDKKSNYWINTGSVLLYLNSNLEPIQTVSNSLNSSSLSKVFVDRSQCLWVCTFGGGVNYCDLNEKKFYTFPHNSEIKNSISGNYIGSILADGKDLWIGTIYNGLNLYNFESGNFSFYNTSNSSLRIKSDRISALILDDAHNLWIGTDIGIEILNPDKKKLWKPAGSEAFPTYSIETLAKDVYGNIWFGNHTNKYGVIWKDGNNHFHVRYYGEGYFILPDKKNPELFVSSTHGLKRLFIDKEGNILKSYDYQATSKPNTLSSNYIYPVCKQNDSTYWVGTIGGGLDRLVTRKDNGYIVQTFSEKYGIFNDVESMEIDNAGNIWMGGNGLQYFNSASGKLITYNKSDGLQGNSFKVGSSYKGADGRLYFGGINGLNYFYPSDIKLNQIPARPVLTGLLINNHQPTYGEVDSTANILPKIISYSRSLKLNYLQNNFVISFSSMHFANPLKCKYRYKLKGYDKEWKYTDGKNPSAAYSNLDYNNYRFILQATNNDGVWSSSEASITITVTAPWWKSLLAKIIYITLFIAGLLSIYIYQARWYRLKREMAVREVNENKREEMHLHREELYQQQLQFFTNISHEFRTPLTLILGPLEKLINENDNTTSAALNNSYQLMFRNVKRLINLINELMNFKKVADSAIKLQVQPLAINQFCKNLFAEFQTLALSKDITFNLVDHTLNETSEQLCNLFDVQILEKILFNLLNNAFKYTHPGGHINLEIFFGINKFKPSFKTEFHLLHEEHHAEKYIYFVIADTGIGISPESIGKIFERYYKIGKNHLGSGVGLALVKSLTHLHKGNISVYSERNKGTEILIALPWGKENFTSDEIILPGNEMTGSQLESLDNTILSPLPNELQSTGHVNGKISKHILLVDDNDELRAFLKQSLEKFYEVYEAEDGNAALTIATSKSPDLIISDVMMPGMSGIEFCKLIKDKFETSHIPFIILSAKDALDAKIEGMESGADYYFAKPLSIDLLLLTVHNIFEQSQRLRLRHTNDYLTEATELVHSEKDKDFMNKLLELIENNIEEPGLDVDFLCNQLYISRTKLYQKIKSISDQSVGEFIKTIRLKKAIQIMTHEDITLNEVAERIGLQSHSYFSRMFKKEFGKSPSQFMQSLKSDVNAGEEK